MRSGSDAVTCFLKFWQQSIKYTVRVVTNRGGWGKSGPLSLLFKYLLTVKCVEANDWLLLQTTEVAMSGIQNFPEKCIRLLSSKTFVNDFEKPLLPHRWGKSGIDGHSCPVIKISRVSIGN